MASHTSEEQIHNFLMQVRQIIPYKTKHPISPLYTRTHEILINAPDAESDTDEGWDGRLVVSPPGRIQAVWDRSNLTQPSFIDTGHVRLDLSHIANIIPL